MALEDDNRAVRDLDGHTFYLLIEDAGRELDSRILVAHCLLDRGAEVWIGQQLWFARNFAALKPGAVLFKGNNIAQVANMRAARLAGHRTASIDEEMFGLIDASGKRLHDPRAALHCDLFLAQGAMQRDFLRDGLGIAPEKIRITGNPRTDLLRTPVNAHIDAAASEIRARTGPFILINTNISGINPHDQDTYNYYRRCVALKAIDPDDPKSLESFHQLCAFETANLQAITRFIAELRILAPTRRIVIRPHPAENPNSWRNALACHPEIMVVEDKRHLAWIRAADALVHTSCTTGFEGALLGARTIGLVPDPGNPFSSRYLSNLVGEIHHDPKAAALALSEEPVKISGDLSRIAPLIHIDNAEPAARKIADALAALSASAARNQRHGHVAANFQAFSPNQRQQSQMTVSETDLRAHMNLLARAAGSHTKIIFETVNRDVFRLTAITGGTQ